ncbi:MAG: lipocalin-like domain-containing protein [Fuerstiella sp.]|nr:lipocalin-like domain-containing protein [Fuerstiella sp.]
MLRTTIFSLSLLLLGGCGREPVDTSDALTDLFPIHASPAAMTSHDDWTAALSPRAFAFPGDHASHEDYRIEWWYYTGNLEADDGSRFGYQLTFFRTGLNKEPNNPSKWAVRDLYTAHFAISDLRGDQHYCFQRNSRSGIGRAGAEVQNYAVWNGDWKAWLDGENHRLQAGESELRIDLTLSPEKPLVLHGERGLSQKGAMAGNASHYYSFTRLMTEGTIRIGGKNFKIKGRSWMDHEFSTSFLEPGQLGWDWLSIQLDNGIDLMLYRMRRDDGTTDPFSSGSLVRKDGQVKHLSVTDFRITPLRDWTSSATDATYPLDWKVEIPGLGYQLVITSAFDEQEMTTNDTTGINYWEGAIEIAGSSAEGSVTGRGYMELTGYAGQGLGALFE